MAICCPKTFTGFCLEDNTPIAITIDNGVLLKWTNLVTGVVTPGNPPAGTGVCEATVTVEIPPIEVAPLTCEKDSVTICPGAEPIPITGTVTVEIAPLTCIKDAVTVCQGTSPWVVSGTVSVIEPVTVDAIDFDIRNLVFATDKVDVSGSVVALDAATLAALETITVNQGTSPWVVSGAVSVTGTITVDAIDFDIRNLDCTTDSVTICPGLEPIVVNQGTSPWVVTGSISSSPLTCETDSITVCPPASGTFDVNVVNASDRFLECETDSITVCPPASGFGVSPLFATRSDTYTGPGSGVVVDRSTSPLSIYSIQVKGTGGAPTSWTVELQGSLNNVNWSPIILHSTVDGDGSVKWIGANLAPSLYFRSSVTALVLGAASNIVVTILGSN